MSRLKVVDSSLLLLYATAYICNVLLTPLDDTFTYEYKRVATFYQQQLPPAFMKKVSVWHALNLVRLAACGLAWGLVCYRSSPHVVAALLKEGGQLEAEIAAALALADGGGGSRGVQRVQQQQQGLRGMQAVGGGMHREGAVPAAAVG